MSFSEAEEDYTMEALESAAVELVTMNQQQHESNRASICIAIAGGGGHALSTLAATPGASSILLEGVVTYDRRSYRSYVGLSSSFEKISHNSKEAARLASEEALRRCMTFKSNKPTQMGKCIGVGCTSALVSAPSSSSSNGGSGFIVATRGDGLQLSIKVELSGKPGGNSRTRMEEDAVLSHLILKSIQKTHLKASKDSVGETEIKTSAGDVFLEEWRDTLGDGAEEDDVALSAAKRLLAGDEEALVLLPAYKDDRPVSFCALKYPLLANGSLIMPGSFNPPHKGHISLGLAALRAAKREGVSKRHDEKPIFMELSLTNADKPPIDPATVSERVHKFLQLEELPEQWGIILTRAPLFSQKVSCLQDCIAEGAYGGIHDISFVIGADTMARILNPKYYNNDKDQMIKALLSMEGAHFFAGGRVEQKKETPASAQFLTGREELGDLPQALKEKFTIIEEQEFRVDISSTEIRKQQEEERLASASKNAAGI